MSHQHHHHDHSQAHASSEGGLSESQKILKLLHHWIHHNDDHAANYIEWARKMEGLGYEGAAERLRTAAELTHTITQEFAAAEAEIREQAQKD